MTKLKFFEELKRELSIKNVSDIDDIISDYEEHFTCKAEEGRTDEEIINKLPTPKEIAAEYDSDCVSTNKRKWLKRLNVSLISIPLVLIYIFMWLTVAAVFCFALCALTLGFCLITGLNIQNLIPNIPYVSALLTSISCFGLFLIALIGSFYMGLYIKHWGKLYIKKCAGYINSVPNVPSSKQPPVSKKASYFLKFTMIVACIVFIGFFILGFVSMALKAGNFEFWHVWHWFE